VRRGGAGHLAARTDKHLRFNAAQFCTVISAALEQPLELVDKVQCPGPDLLDNRASHNGLPAFL
jgi:hypothetical protein